MRKKSKIAIFSHDDNDLNTMFRLDSVPADVDSKQDAEKFLRSLELSGVYSIVRIVDTVKIETEKVTKTSMASVDTPWGE